MLGVAACRRGLCMQISPEGDGSLEGWRPGEDQLGVPGGQRDTASRLTRLNEYRVPLRRAWKRQDALDVVVLTMEARGVQLRAICPDAVRAIADHRVVGPAVPRACDGVDEFVSMRIPIVAFGVNRSPKFAAANGVTVVTMFQPARPPLR